MHTVALLNSFVNAAEEAGLDDDEINAVVNFFAENPDAGDQIKGSGGCRKTRFSGKGKGKRGGIRTITFFTGNRMPVFLLTLFAKGERVDLSQKEVKQLKTLTSKIVVEYESKVASLAKKG